MNFINSNQKTRLIYRAIQNHQYSDAVEMLNHQLQVFPRSRSALSLVGYCYYHIGDFESSVTIYEKLVKIYHDVDEYKIYLGQSLFKCNRYADAKRILLHVNSIHLQKILAQLSCCIYFERDELNLCRNVLNSLTDKENPLWKASFASVLLREGKFSEARLLFQDVLEMTSSSYELSYNIALSLYHEKLFDQALKWVNNVVPSDVRTNGLELSNIQSLDFKNTIYRNSSDLKNDAVEARNLKMSIEYAMGNDNSAANTLRKMPYREESERDAVSLHNEAILEVNLNPKCSLKKLSFLLNNPPFPPSTFVNLLLLHCRYGNYNLAADILAENDHLKKKMSSNALLKYLDALILVESFPEEAYRKFDEIINKSRYEMSIREKTSPSIKILEKQYDQNNPESCILIALMAKCLIYWNKECFPKVQALLDSEYAVCESIPAWKINMAHALFMQAKYKDAIAFYEPIINDQSKTLLEIPAIVLANLCVSYIMTSRNEEAEELMRLIEKEEDLLQLKTPTKQVLHLCIINLCIGTLYCSKGNYEFGISRVLKSLEPFDRKLNADTWFYSKRCFLSFAENISKMMIVPRDDTVAEISIFLSRVANDFDAHQKITDFTILECNSENELIKQEARAVIGIFQLFYC